MAAPGRRVSRHSTGGDLVGPRRSCCPPRNPAAAAAISACTMLPQFLPHYYGGYILDPDGNNSEAVWRTPA
jgi:hypothetical protein